MNDIILVICTHASFQSVINLLSTCKDYRKPPICAVVEKSIRYCKQHGITIKTRKICDHREIIFIRAKRIGNSGRLLYQHTIQEFMPIIIPIVDDVTIFYINKYLCAKVILIGRYMFSLEPSPAKAIYTFSAFVTKSWLDIIDLIDIFHMLHFRGGSADYLRVCDAGVARELTNFIKCLGCADHERLCGSSLLTEFIRRKSGPY